MPEIRGASYLRTIKGDGKPLVFISASSQDYGWRDRLKPWLEEYADRIEWWDDSKIRPASLWSQEIEAAIQRASLAVVLLSPEYLSSSTATFELQRLIEEADSGRLWLFPIVLKESAWQQFTALRRVNVWAGAKPINDLVGEAAERELEKIAKSILAVALDRQASRQNPEPAAEIDPPDPASLPGPERISNDADRTHEVKQPRPEFLFSTTARAVLDRAWVLAKQTGRDAITSSCLLFGLAERAGHQSDTTRFVNDLVNRSGRYQAAFDTFVSEGPESRPNTSVVAGFPWKFSRNARAIVEQAALFTLRVGDTPGEVHARHLFAALLVTADTDRPLAARSRLTALGIGVSATIFEFREYLKIHASRDEQAAWDALLGFGMAWPKPMGGGDGDPKQEVAARRGSGIVAYQQTYSAFVPDRAAYGRRTVDGPLDDALGVGVHAGHLAQLIAAKDTFMPLSIGLFGAWGAGKSHFMDLLDERLRMLMKNPGQVFHSQIVQIRFNAWHYLDTNLWANLVSEIFDQLFAKLDEDEDTSEAQVENLKKELANQSALAAEAKGALDIAEKARKDAEEQVLKAMKERKAEENVVRNMLDDLGNLLANDPYVRKQLGTVADGLGLPKLQSSFEELEARAEEVRSLGGRTKALVLAVFTGPGWWARAFLLVVALALPLGVAWVAANGPAWIKELLAGAGRTIAQVVVAIGALSTWIATQAKTGNALVGKLESAYDKVKQIRAKREAKDDAAMAQKTLAAKRQAEEEARHTLHEAEEKMKVIRAELAEMAPGRQLIRFLKERASAEDYRRHLGLVSLVRRDFEQLSNLLLQTGNGGEDKLPKIDRIVLYIDDLDRCRADRVIEVLEAVHLLLAFPLFAVVVAVDPRWLRQSLLDHYPNLLGGADDNALNSSKRQLGRPATPQDYLEKIFQVPFNLQAMERPGFEALVKRLFPFKDTALSEIKNESADSRVPLASDPAPRQPQPETRLETAAVAPVDVTPTLPAAPETASAETKQIPPDPQRLALTRKEIEDVQRFQILFQTPRAVKRLANTYCLIRVGVDQADWDEYLGSERTAGAYRVPLLLLAVTSAFPALARPWLMWLRETAPAEWQLKKDTVGLLAEKNLDSTDREDWDRLAHSLDLLSLQDWPAPQAETLAKWAPRVSRYSF